MELQVTVVRTVLCIYVMGCVWFVKNIVKYRDGCHRLIRVS